MKAKVKETRKIVEVELRTFTSVRGTPITRYVDIDTEEIYVQDDLEILPPNEENSLPGPDYWTRLEHQAAIAAMQGMLASREHYGLLTPNQIASDAYKYAHALVEKYKKEEK